jgi:nucleoside-triphosphatase
VVNLPDMPGRRIISGERGTGKTTFCRSLAEMACASQWKVSGILSLPRFEGGAKTGIELLDLRTGVSRLLASTHPDELIGFRFCGWFFSAAALAWGNDIIGTATPCDLLIVDEIGPMELKSNKGITACLPQLQGKAYRLAIAVVRPTLAEQFRLSWESSSTLVISSNEQALEQSETLWREFQR